MSKGASAQAPTRARRRVRVCDRELTLSARIANLGAVGTHEDEGGWADHLEALHQGAGVGIVASDVGPDDRDGLQPLLDAGVGQNGPLVRPADAAPVGRKLDEDGLALGARGLEGGFEGGNGGDGPDLGDTSCTRLAEASEGSERIAATTCGTDEEGKTVDHRGDARDFAEPAPGSCIGRYGIEGTDKHADPHGEQSPENQGDLGGHDAGQHRDGQSEEDDAEGLLCRDEPRARPR